jgi:hypothetical protein
MSMARYLAFYSKENDMISKLKLEIDTRVHCREKHAFVDTVIE